MVLLLDRRNNKIKITEEVVKAATRNWDSGIEIIALLLDRHGNKVRIIEEVVIAAAGNRGSNIDVI